MQVAVIGMSHKSAPLSLQEKVARACSRKLFLSSAWSEALSCVVLATCHRTEVYFTAEDPPRAHSDLLALLREEIDEPFEHRVYTYFGVDCFAHLATVISGWDSLILGETQIHRQVRMAYENAKLHYLLDSQIHYLFQKSLKIAKGVRACRPHTTLSLPQIIWDLAREELGSLNGSHLLLVGNSEMNRKILEFLHPKKMEKITLCTRAPLSAGDLSRRYAIRIADWSELKCFGLYDLVICSTHASEYVLQEVGERGKTRLIIDLSVPRVVDPRLGDLPGLSLWNMEQIATRVGAQEGVDLSVSQKIWRQVETYAMLLEKKRGLARCC